MSKPAIIVDGINKKYRIGLKERPRQSFREAASGILAAPLRHLRRSAGIQRHDDDFWALKDVSFEVQPGEVVGIIGRNGAGKSTLLKILSRITEPTSGEIRVRGRVASLLEVGTGFHPELTGRENIYLNGAILGMKRTEITRKFDEIVAFAEVEKFLDTPVKHYSSGMYVRLAFAVAAHLEPEILIVDEVLAVGDAEFQKKCLGKMQEVSHGSGRTVLFVSHNMAAMQSLCTKGVLLRDGQVLCSDSVNHAVQRYMSGDGRAVEVLSPCRVGNLKLARAEVLPLAGNSIRTLRDAKICLELEPTKDIVNLGMRILIETAECSAIADLDTYPAHPRMPLEAGVPKTVEVVLRDLPLRPGDYRLRISLRDDGIFRFWDLPQPLLMRVEPSLEAGVNCRHLHPSGSTAIRFSLHQMPQEV